MTIPLQFASLYYGQVFVWSNCLLDLCTDFLVGNMVFVWDVFLKVALKKLLHFSAWVLFPSLFIYALTCVQLYTSCLRVLCGRLEEKKDETCRILKQADESRCGTYVDYWYSYYRRRNSNSMSISALIRMAGCPGVLLPPPPPPGLNVAGDSLARP